MAYFGGGVSERPWSRIDVRFMSVFILSFCGIGASLFLAKDLAIFQSEASIQEAQAASIGADTAVTMVTVLLAAGEIPAGTRLAPEMFRFAAMPVRSVGSQVVRDLTEIVNTFSRVGISAETPLLRSALTTTEPQADIVTRIPAGYRAVAIPVNPLTGVEGWLRPGATVDVVWSTQRGQQLAVSTIVENAKVLSVERMLEVSDKAKVIPKIEPSHLTLLVSQQDAQKIQLAKGTGSLNLSLRGAKDGESVGSTVLTAESLLARRNPSSLIQGRVSIQGVEYVLYNRQLLKQDEFEHKVAEGLFN